MRRQSQSFVLLLGLVMLRSAAGLRWGGGVTASTSTSTALVALGGQRRRLSSSPLGAAGRELVVVCGGDRSDDLHRRTTRESVLASLLKLRPHLHVSRQGATQGGCDKGIMWSLHSGDGMNMQLDCAELYLGHQKLSADETAKGWNDIMNHRQRPGANMGDGGKLQAELNEAMAAVHRASFMSRSLQKNFLSVSKDDKSPVTIADFAVQALVVDALSKAFPEDKFIAEEDSEALRDSDPAIRGAVLSALQAATSSVWTEERLYSTVDRGSFTGKAPRVWVLDPVDGTKGFIRGEHYCIALALLVDGKPQLSVMGCPNVSLPRVLDPEATQAKGGNVADIDSCFGVAVTADDGAGAGAGSGELLRVHPPSAGSVFYAVQGRGAWARSLSMPLGAGYEVTVSGVREASAAALCESVEASHGDRAVTQGVFKRLGLTRDFLRLEGQCKYCIVGSGAAEGNLRLPPLGYREKIWDAAPGAHFITEAGGRVTDLEGRELDFGEGRLLPEHVQGIVSTNSLVHADILSAIREERGTKTVATKRVFLD